MSYGEEWYRNYQVEVLECAETRIILRVNPVSEYADPVSDRARFVLGLLLERSQATPRKFGESLPALDQLDHAAMTAAAPEYIASVARRESESESDSDSVTLEVIVTDAESLAHFEPGMRWLAFGFAEEPAS